MIGLGDSGQGSGLLEREAELGRLATAIERAAAGEGSVLHVEGPAGIGKTGLLEAARELARERGLGVPSARGGELERDFAYGIVRRLFERRLVEADEAERAELLAGSAALAAPAVGLEGGAPPPADDAAGAVLHGLYWLTANLSARTPLLVAVDDVHWADRASLRFLAFLAARVDELPIALLTTGRPRQPGGERALVDQLVAVTEAELLHPAALSVQATVAVVADQLDGEVDAAFAEACHQATGGNPFLLHELTGALRADGSGTSAADVGRVSGLGPNTVSRSLLLRLSAMPHAATAIASAVAVLGNDVELQHAAAFAGVDLAEAGPAIDALVDAEVLAPERPLNFVHPMVRSAVYAEMGPGEQAAAHALAARVLSTSGVSPERVAPHVIHSTPAGDRAVVRLLREAAAAALVRGAPDTAALYLRRATDENAAARSDGALLCELGTAEYMAGEAPEQALAHLREGIPRIDDRERRAEAWLTLSRTTMSYFDVPDAVGVLERAIEDLSDEGDSRMRLEVELTSLGITHAESFQRSAARIDALPEVRGRTPVERLMLCNRAYRSWQVGADIDRTADLCARAIAGGRLVADEGTESSAVAQVVYVMCFADLIDEARAQLDQGLAQASAHGSGWGFASASGCRGGLNYFAGDLASAEADCRQALEVAGCPPFAVPYISACLALTLVERGELDEAEAIVERAGCGPGLPPIVHMDLLFWARARVRAAQGRDAEALADLLEYGARSERVGVHNPGIPWRADAALACARVGDEERSRELAAEHLRRATVWGAPSVVGAALTVQGLLLGRDEGLQLLEQATDVLASSPARLTHARSLVELGAALRRAGRRREARERLRVGLDAARRCGAIALVERAHDELVTAGARPRRLMFSGLDALTASERRVADMAANGLSNREIAQGLFVTVKTVENHLGRAYAKLDIHSREELPTALAAEPVT